MKPFNLGTSTSAALDAPARAPSCVITQRKLRNPVKDLRQLELVQKVWTDYEKQRDDDSDFPDFFRAVAIAADGGFSEVDELWYTSRWVSAAIMVFFVISNYALLLYTDIPIILGQMPLQAKRFLLSRAVLRYMLHAYVWITGQDKDELDAWVPEGPQIVAAIECFGLGFLTYLLCKHIINVCIGHRQGDVRFIWFTVEHLFWTIIPEISWYSAIRLLHYVHPAVLLNDAWDKYTKTTERWHGNWWLITWKWTKFVVTRIFYLLVGFDAFLMKCRENYHFLKHDILTPLVILGALNFLRQVLGVVQINLAIRDRLFLFVFGGEDAILQPREAATMQVWNAMLVREIWNEYSITKFIVIMLSFDDMDFQKLVLNERNHCRRSASVRELDSSCLSDGSSDIDNSAPSETSYLCQAGGGSDLITMDRLQVPGKDALYPHFPNRAQSLVVPVHVTAGWQSQRVLPGYSSSATTTVCTPHMSPRSRLSAQATHSIPSFLGEPSCLSRTGGHETMSQLVSARSTIVSRVGSPLETPRLGNLVSEPIVAEFLPDCEHARAST